MRPPASQKTLLIQVLYRAWKGAGLSAFTPNAGAVVTVFLGLTTGGCSLSQGDGPFAMMMDKVKMTGRDVTGSIKLPEGVEMVMPGDNVRMDVELITPIACEEGLRFAIREGGRTVGAGVVTKVTE